MKKAGVESASQGKGEPEHLPTISTPTNETITEREDQVHDKTGQGKRRWWAERVQGEEPFNQRLGTEVAWNMPPVVSSECEQLSLTFPFWPLGFTTYRHLQCRDRGTDPLSADETLRVPVIKSLKGTSVHNTRGGGGAGDRSYWGIIIHQELTLLGSSCGPRNWKSSTFAHMR